MYSVYVHTFPNGKKYVGISSDPLNRWGSDGKGYKKEDQPKMYNAVKRYGWENISHEIVKTGLTESEAKAEEIRLIKEFDSYHHGYNADLGGGIHRKTFLHPWIANAQRQIEKHHLNDIVEIPLYSYIESAKEDEELCKNIEDLMTMSLPIFFGYIGRKITNEEMSRISDIVEIGKFYSAMNQVLLNMETG